MCRFLAYIGKKSIKLDELLKKPSNSLIDQSFNGKLGKVRVHGDGCGFGWYDQHQKPTPFVFKSLQPAWSDPCFNLLSTQISSNCFIGHIRAASVGPISCENSHPFTYGRFLFAHNGTIHDFPSIKEHIVQELSSTVFDYLHGQTDSEYFFALLMQYMRQDAPRSTIDAMIFAFNNAIRKIYAIKREKCQTSHFKLNTVLTDGRQLMATRFASNLIEEPLPLFYALVNSAIIAEGKVGEIEGCIVSSEPLTNAVKEWHEIPKNHMLIIQEDLQLRFLEISLPQFCLLFILFCKKLDMF